MNTRIIFSIIITIFGLSVSAQTSISGMVTDTKGESLPGANVYLDGTYDGASTQADGSFSFTTSEIGEHILKVEFIGYKPHTQNVKLDGFPIKLQISLKESFNQLNAVTITAGTFEASDRKKSVILSSQDMVTTPSANGDVYGALQSLPGTTTVGESGRLFVKGGHSDESQTYIDGTLVHTPYGASPPNMATRGRFNPFMFQGTIFSTGGYSAEYGQALSSVLLLNTHDMPSQDELHISLLSIGASLAGTKLWKDGAATASFGYSNLKPYMSVVPQNHDWINAPSGYEGAVSIRQKTGKSGMFKFYGSFSKSDFMLNRIDLDQGSKETAYDLDNDNVYVNASWKSILGKDWVIKSGISLTSNTDHVNFDQSTFEETLKGSHIKSVLSNKIHERVLIKAGAEVYTKDYKESFRNESADINNDFLSNTVAGFAEADIYASNKFVTRIGTRVEYSDYLKQANIAPRLSTAYKLNDHSQISLAYGWFYQDAPNNYLLYTDQIDYERADHYTLSFQSGKNHRILRSEIYYKNYQDLTKLNQDAFYMPESYSNDGRGYAYGLDLFWRDKKSIRNGEYWISYSFLDTERNYRNFPNTSVPTFASKHNISLVYKHWIGSLRSLVGGSYKYSSPRNYNNPNSQVFNDAKTLAYQSLDANWSFLYRDNVIIYAGVTNVLGFKQEFGHRYSKTPNSNGIYESAPIIPGSNRFFVLGCFISLSTNGDVNQLDKID